MKKKNLTPLVYYIYSIYHGKENTTQQIGKIYEQTLHTKGKMNGEKNI